MATRACVFPVKHTDRHPMARRIGLESTNLPLLSYRMTSSDFYRDAFPQ